MPHFQAPEAMAMMHGDGKHSGCKNSSIRIRESRKYDCSYIFSPNDRAQWQEHFRTEGFVVLANIIDHQTRLQARKGCNELVAIVTERLEREGKLSKTSAFSEAVGEAGGKVRLDNIEEGPLRFDEKLLQISGDCPAELPNLFRSELHRRQFFPLLCHRRLLNVVSQLLPADDIRIYPNYSCRPKTPSKVHDVTWHQDAGLRADGGPSTAPISDRLDAFGMTSVVNCWTPLVPTRVENGAMKFIPKSHLAHPLNGNNIILQHELLGSYEGSTLSGEKLPGASPKGQESAKREVPPGTYKTGISPSIIEKFATQFGILDVQCDPGDIVLFSNLLIHRGGINQTRSVRWSFDFRFQDASKPTYRSENGHVVFSRSKVSGSQRRLALLARQLKGNAMVHTPQQWAKLTLC